MTFGVRMRPGASPGRWSSGRRIFRRGTGTFYRKIQSLKFLLTRDRRAVVRFLRARYPLQLPLARRIALLRRFYRITHAVRGYHTLEEILIVTDRILRLAGRENLTVVEAGAGSGSSTTKLSLAVRLAGGRLVVFDSFRGIPENDEQHHLLDGRPLTFRRGAFRGRLSAVKKRVAELGAPEVCEFHKGLFTDTLPRMSGPVDVALLDVDLAASTRACTQFLYPRLRPGGALISQDGHLRATVDLFADQAFWRNDVGVEPPEIRGLGEDKLLIVPAPTTSRSPTWRYHPGSVAVRGPRRGRQSLELVDHGDEPLIDHKGRTKPLYKRRTKRPPRSQKRWRPGAFTKLLLGTFPGARLIVLESVNGGLPYAIVGLLALIATVFLATRVGVTMESLRILAIEPYWFLIHAAALVVAVAIYELARMGASLEERTDKPRAARAAAALVLPTLLITIGAPKLVPLHPRLVEATWLGATVLLLGVLPATIRCVFDFGRLFETPRARLLAGLACALIVGIALATALGIDDARRAIASAAASAGFEILPKLLS